MIEPWYNLDIIFFLKKMTFKKAIFYTLAFMATFWLLLLVFLVILGLDWGLLLFVGIQSFLLVSIAIAYRFLFKDLFIKPPFEAGEWETENLLYKIGFRLLVVSICIGFLANTVFFPFGNYNEEMFYAGLFFYLILSIFGYFIYALLKKRRVEYGKWFFPIEYKLKFKVLSLMGYIGLLLVIYGMLGFYIMASGLTNRPVESDFLRFIPGF